MNKKIAVAVVFLALFLAVGIVTVMAQNFCFFANGVSVTFSEKTVYFRNESDTGANVPHKVHFKDGTSVGPKSMYVPANGYKNEKYDKIIVNVEQCW